MQLTISYIKAIRNFSFLLLFVIFISCSKHGIYQLSSIKGSYISVDKTLHPSPETT